MTAEIIDGKKIAADLKAEVKEEVSELKQSGVTPGLAVVLAGDDPASHIYVRQKELACEEAGLYSEKHSMAADVSQDELLSKIEQLNKDDKIDGILVQLPLPAHIDEKTILRSVDPQKDVDGFHPVNVGKLSINEDTFYPCTPSGIIVMLERSGIDIAHSHAVIVGRSNIVGKPVSMLLLNKSATITVCHSKTHDLASMTRQADILVVAIGRPNFITKDMVKPGAAVIDVGINRLSEKLVGDVDFSGVSEVAGKITPVPGGVGPMTIAMLLGNTVKAAKLRRANS